MINTDCVEIFDNQYRVEDWVRDQVWYQVEDQVYVKMWCQVRDQVCYEVWLNVFR